ncbi:MAG: hypothetical protein ACRYG7_23040 [Janthinobacterium lividum]
MNRRTALAKPTAQTLLDLYDLRADELTAHILGYLRAQGFVVWAQDNRGGAATTPKPAAGTRTPTAG